MSEKILISDAGITIATDCIKMSLTQLLQANLYALQRKTREITNCPVTITFCDIIHGKSRSSIKLLMDAILGSAVQPYMKTLGFRL